MNDELTPQEKRAIATLNRLAKRWPKSLWLMATGSLHVMKKRNGIKASMGVGRHYDQEAIIATIAIENDGGDF